MTSTITKLFNRAPVNVGDSVSGLSLNFRRKGAATGQLEAMGTVGTLFSIVHRTSTATSNVQWSLYRKRGPRADANTPRQKILKHAALDLWNKPNKFYHQQIFVETFQQHHDLTGEAYWVLVRPEGYPNMVPIEMWPVRPDRMQPVPHPTEYLSGYLYTGSDGEKIPLNLNEVIFLRSPNPTDPYRGMGPVQSILADLDSQRYSAEWNRKFFVNSAEPGGVIEVPGELDDKDFRRLQMQWRERHQGVSQAHRVAILENSMKWVSNSFSQKDMQFVELRNAGREIILEAFGMSKTMLGQTESVNRATAEAAEYVFSKYALTERLNRIRNALNNDLLPLFYPENAIVDTEFDYEDVIPEDEAAETAEMTANVNAAVQLIDAGFDPSATLAAFELPDIPFKGKPPVGQNSIPDYTDRSWIKTGEGE